MRALRLAAGLGLVVAVVIGTATGASAHPLGNFTVNHADSLTVYSDRVTDDAVLDLAEIPTAQQREALDVDRDGTITAAERSAFARMACSRLAASLRLTVSQRRQPLRVDAAGLELVPGAVRLDTTRIQCALSSAVTIRRTTEVSFSDGYQGDRVGWHEVTASAVGLRLVASSVPAKSLTEALRHYPNELLSSPLDVRVASLRVAPGAGGPAAAIEGFSVPHAGPLTVALQHVTTTFDALVGSRHLSVGAIALAVLLAMLIGAGHAALPGHGKTIMAAYLAGRDGTARDAAVVGLTVTLTHTVGVLALGVLLTASAAVAGETVLRYMGLISGVLIVAIGIGLLRSTVSGARAHHHHEHEHDHEHHHGHGHDHHHEHPHRRGRGGLVGMGIAGGLVPSPSALVVLLGAVALGRTALGVVLVLAYGVGMAGTLTVVGLVLVSLRERLAHGIRHPVRRLQVGPLVPLGSALLIVAVGATIAARSLPAIA